MNYSIKQDPLVTVGMVTYNSERTIIAAIRSVLSSSWANFELLIIDDKSTDSTWDLISSFNDGRIVKIQNEINLGEYSNRNRILENTKGDFLIFIDGDDMIYPHGLEFMTRMLLAFPNSGMALMRWYKNNVFYPLEISPADFFRGVYFNYGFDDIAFANTFFNVKCLKEIGPFPTDFPFGDSFARLNLALKYNVLLISDGLTWWRETPGQASGSHSRNLSSLISFFGFKLNMLYTESNPLSKQEKILAYRNLKKDIVRAGVVFVKKLQFNCFFILLREFNISLKDFIFYRCPYYTEDPFKKNSSLHPACVALECNPYSKK